MPEKGLATAGTWASRTRQGSWLAFVVPFCAAVFAVGTLVLWEPLGLLGQMVVDYRLPALGVLLVAIVLLTTSSGDFRASLVGAAAGAACGMIGCVLAYGLDASPGSPNTSKVLLLLVGASIAAWVGPWFLFTALAATALLLGSGPALNHFVSSALWPYGAYALLFVAAGYFTLRSPRVAVARIREVWGIRYLLFLVILAMVLTPLHAQPGPHSWNLFLAVLFVPAMASESKHSILRWTSGLLVGVAIYQIAVVVYRAAGLGAAAGEFMQRYEGDPGRIGGPGIGAVVWVQIFLIAIPVVLALAGRIPGRVLLSVVAVLASAYLVWRASVRAAMISAPVQAIVYFAARRWFAASLAIVAMGVAAIVAVEAVSAPFADIAETGWLEGGMANNVSGRVLLWQAAVGELGTDPAHWLFGLGTGRLIAWEGSPSEWAHNSWVHFLHAYGILGVLLLGAFFVSVCRGLMRALRSSSADARYWAAAGLASITGALVFSLSGALEAEASMYVLVAVVLHVWARVSLPASGEVAQPLERGR